MSDIFRKNLRSTDAIFQRGILNTTLSNISASSTETLVINLNRDDYEYGMANVGNPIIDAFSPLGWRNAIVQFSTVANDAVAISEVVELSTVGSGSSAYSTRDWRSKTYLYKDELRLSDGGFSTNFVRINLFQIVGDELRITLENTGTTANTYHLYIEWRVWK